MSEHLSRAEFREVMGEVKDSLRDIHDDIKEQNGRVRKNTTAVAVLDERSKTRMSRATPMVASGGAVLVLAEIIRELVMR